MTNQGNPQGFPHRHAFDPYYRANAKGTGSAVKFELHPAHGETAGSIFVTLAAQKTIGSRQGEAQIFPTFDWKRAITLKLDRSDLSHVLQVLRGMKESINGEKGLFHVGARGRAVIRFTHQIEPRPGYMLSVWKTYGTGEQQKGYYFFDIDEAFTLMLALERALFFVCFGIPEVIARPAAVPVQEPAVSAQPPEPAPEFADVVAF